MKKRIKGEGVVYYNPYVPYSATAVIKDEHRSRLGFEAGYFEDGWWSDGCYMVLTGKLPKLPKNGKLNDRKITHLLKKFKSTATPGKILGVLNMGNEAYEPLVHVMNKNRSMFFNAKYIDHIFTVYPNAKTFICDDALAFRDKRKLVGAVMRVRIEAEDVMTNYFWMRFESINGLKRPKAKQERQSVAM